MFVSVLNWALGVTRSKQPFYKLLFPFFPLSWLAFYCRHQRQPFRATLSRKLTALFCRLPLPTLIYWPEASHLGDLLRLLVRPSVVLFWFAFVILASFSFHGSTISLFVWKRTASCWACSSWLLTLSRSNSNSKVFAGCPSFVLTRWAWAEEDQSSVWMKSVKRKRDLFPRL